MPASPRRRWLRYSLRTLLVLITALGIWFGVSFYRAPWEGNYHRALASIRGTFAVGPTELAVTREGYVMQHKDYTEEGIVEIEEPNMVLSMTRSTGNAPEVVRKFVFIPWSPKAYLVDANYVIGFCNEVNAGEAPRGTYVSTVLVKGGDDVRPSGLPAVPEPFRKYLLSKPLSARVISIDDRQSQGQIPSLATTRKVLRAVIIPTSEGQLLPGLELWATNSSTSTLHLATVLDDNSKTPTVLIERMFGQDPINVGMEFSTKQPSLGVLTSDGIQPLKTKTD